MIRKANTFWNFHFFLFLALGFPYSLKSFIESDTEIYTGWTSCFLSDYCSLDTQPKEIASAG